MVTVVFPVLVQICIYVLMFFLSFLLPLSLDPKDAAPVSPAPLSFACTSERAPCPGGAAVGGGVFRVRTSPRTEQIPLSLKVGGSRPALPVTLEGFGNA